MINTIRPFGEWSKDEDNVKYAKSFFTKIIDNGNKTVYYLCDKIHRDDDEPAIICADGGKYWYKNGKLHRDRDEPTVICADGTKEWYKNGKRHTYFLTINDIETITDIDALLFT